MSDTLLINSSNITQKCLNLAKSLMTRCQLSPPISHIKNISGDLIVLLFESITEFHIPDLVHCINKENEAHNVQAVIDTLSLDLLGISLSHITGDDVVAGNEIAIYNLLEVLEGIAIHLKSGGSIHLPQISKRAIVRKKKSLLSASGSDTNGQGVKKVSSLLTPQSKIGIRKRYKKRLTSKDEHKRQSRSKIGEVSQTQSSETEYPHIVFQLNDNIKVKIKAKPSSDISGQSTASEKETRSHSKHASLGDIAGSASSSMDHQSGPTTTYTKIPIKRKTVKLPPEKPNVRSTVANKEVEELYNENLENQVRLLIEKSNIQNKASKLKTKHLQNLKRSTKKSPVSLCRKSYLLPHNLRRRSISRPTHKQKTTPRKKQAPNTSKQDDRQSSELPRVGFVQELLDEFPGLQLPPSIVNHIRLKYQQHLLNMHRKVKRCLQKSSKTQMQADAVSKKQSLLSSLLKKNIQHEQYMKQFSEYKQYEGKLKYRLRDARLQSAKMKQYCEEFRDDMRKKMQKRNFSEELILENLFKEVLNMQKEQVAGLCQDVEENRENDARQHLAYLEALENLYQTQFSMFSETFAAEKAGAQEQLKAEQQEIKTMQREFQEELKKEIRFMQKVIVECMEDVHFRELDAEQYKDKLRKKLS